MLFIIENVSRHKDIKRDYDISYIIKRITNSFGHTSDNKFIEINSLDELLKLQEKVNQRLIIENDIGTDYKIIKIFDDYL